ADGYSGESPPIFSTGFSTWNSIYGPWFSSLAPASLPVSPSLPVPPSTPLALPPATPLPLKSLSLVATLDKSIAGRLVGTLTGGGTTWNPFGGAGVSTFGSSGALIFGGSGGLGFGASTFLGGGGSLGGGGGSAFLTATNLTFSAFTRSCLRVPARAVAKTAKKMIATCNMMLKMVPLADRPFLVSFLDSSNLIIAGSPCLKTHFCIRQPA